MNVRALPATWSLPRIRVGAELFAWVGLAWFAWFLGGWAQGGDAAVYYAVGFPPDYSASSILTPSYQYSPSFALLVQPFQALGWQGFHTLIVAAEIMALAYLVGPLLALLLIGVQAPLVFPELLEGNLNLVAGALVVAGMRSPWAWAPLLLTKITPGVGLVWFAVRREWRLLGIAAGITLLAILPGLVAPGSWADWIGLLTANGARLDGSLPLLARAPVAVALVVWGARTNRAWTVPLGVALSFPVNGLGWVVALGVIRIYRTR